MSFLRDADEEELNYEEDSMDLEDMSAPSSGWYATGGGLGGRHSEELNGRYKSQQGMPEKVVHQDFFNDFEDDFDDENLK